MRLHDFFDVHAREHPQHPCISFGGRTLSYAEAAAESHRLARALLASGLGPGDRFGLLAKNALEYLLFFLAGSKTGIVPVPLNYRLAPPELAYILNDARTRLVVARGECTLALDPVRGSCPEAKTWVALDAPDAAGWTDYQEWIGRESSLAPEQDPATGADDLYQMYTSGTTGRPKGAILSQRAVIDHLFQQLLLLQLPPRERVLLVAPLYHAAAALTALGALVAGSTAVIHEDFVPQAVVQALSEDGITRTTLVPAMIQACLVAVPDVASRRYDALKLIVYGASPIAADVLRRALEVFRCDFAQGYGMTETTAALTFLSPDDHRRALAEKPELLLSAGRALPGTKLRVVRADGSDAAPGEIGEILGRGPQLMRGYWNLPDASAEALRDGWMHTGDAGTLDAEGYLYLQDRVKDMIVSGGENVYPREVENVLFGHPAVADVAVIGVPDPKWGEAVKAIVVLRQGAEATPEALVQYCRGQLGGYKCPRSVDFVDALPRNPSGKVLKKDLREKYWAGQSRRVS
ncbi:MAG: long-chain-fatty-acid--CoA ligase [Myxococcales bacterium]|nr:MAG: long-chain-fatty-acid--CoA ligase [Myxococcales bacterium]